MNKSRGRGGKTTDTKRKHKKPKNPRNPKKEKRKSAPASPRGGHDNIKDKKQAADSSGRRNTQTGGSGRSASDPEKPSAGGKIEPKLGNFDWVDLPQFALRKLVTSGRLLQLSGPEIDYDGESFECWEPYACGRSTSNYPMKKIVNNKVVHMGDPIADYFLVRVYVNRALIALADGCGWGAPARDASRIAANTFLSYIEARQHSDMIDVRDAGRLILRAFCEAHKKILKSYDDIWEAGTTTMLAGLLLELSPDEPDKHNGENGQQADDESPDEVLCCADEPNGHGKHNGAVNGQEKEKEKGKKRGKSASRPEEGTEKEPEDNEEEDKGKEKEGPKEEVRWVFICASVGDCKTLHYSKKTGEVTDITHGNRLDVRSASDPGGRLGAMVGDGAPDLRNLFIHLCPCDEGDLLILLSDGIHDNFDPVTRGMSPSDIGLPDDAWSAVSDSLLLQKKSQYLKQRAEEIINALPKSPTLGVPAAQDVAFAFVEEARNTCIKSIAYMEASGEQLPEDLKEYPGKMDHATCLCLHVGYHLQCSHQAK